MRTFEDLMQRLLRRRRAPGLIPAVLTLGSELTGWHINASGLVVPLGVLSRRLVTDAGVAFLVDAFQGTTEPEKFNHHDAGTGVGAEAVGNTGLGTPWGGARVAGTQSEPAANQYRTTATIAFNNTFAITEHGLFSAAAAGTLWDRSVFSAVNVVNGESIQFQYTLTINSGG